MSDKTEMKELAKRINAKFEQLNILTREQSLARKQQDVKLLGELEHAEQTLYIQTANLAFRLATYITGDTDEQ